MKNITITLDETPRLGTTALGSRGISVSRLIRELPQSQMQRDSDYEEARQRYFAMEPQCLRGPASAIRRGKKSMTARPSSLSDADGP